VSSYELVKMSEGTQCECLYDDGFLGAATSRTRQRLTGIEPLLVDKRIPRRCGWHARSNRPGRIPPTEQSHHASWQPQCFRSHSQTCSQSPQIRHGVQQQELAMWSPLQQQQ